MATLEEEFMRKEILAEERGLAKGHANATERLNKLTSALLAANRIDDLKKSTEEPEFQQALLEEFGL